jgi:hypothetical protein
MQILNLRGAIFKAFEEMETKNLQTQVQKVICVEGHVRDFFAKLIMSPPLEKHSEEFFNLYDPIFGLGKRTIWTSTEVSKTPNGTP